MTDALVETTVLTNYLLKRDQNQAAAQAKLATYSKLYVPQFAWKEFKRGPLTHFVWLYNKLKDTESFAETLAALQSLSGTPQRYKTSTAIQAAHTAYADVRGKMNLASLVAQYGEKADFDTVTADVQRLRVKEVIFDAWEQRRSLGGGQWHLLSCYPDADLAEAKGQIDCRPRDCPNDADCCLSTSLASKAHVVAKIRSALPPDDSRKEIAKRRKVLKRLEKHPKQPMDREQCQAFGDAYFVLFCPKDTVIVTTNRRDIVPLANALGVSVDTP